jgi:hypothetical protein
MSTDLATKPTVPAAPEAYLLFDRADDDAVLARIRGSALDACVYHFKQGGQELYGLGIDGAEECKREMARQGEVIEEDDVQIERETPDALFLKARASRWAVTVKGETPIRVKLDTAIGVKRQSLIMRRRDGTEETNPHYWEQGCAKAMRNAILRLTPQALQQKVIDAFKARGKVREVRMDPDTAEAMVEEAHQLFPHTPEEDERATLIGTIKAIIADHQIPEERVKKLKLAWLGDQDADPRRCDVAALRAFKDHLRG